MTAFTEKLDRAAGAALCEALTVGGQSLIGYGAVGLAAGGTGVVPIAAGSLALMAAAAGCRWDPDQPGPGGTQPPALCYEGGSLFQIRQLTNGVFIGGATPDLREITDVAFREKTDCQTGGSRESWTISWINEFGQTGSTGLLLGGPCGGSVYDWEQVWAGDDTCEKPGPEPEPIDIPPYEYTDPEDGCKLTVNFKGFQVDPTGGAAPVFKIEPAPETRADGGIIGGCNFSPVIYTGPGPEGCQCSEPRPWNPDWDVPVPPGGTPPWVDFLNDLAGGVISNIITNAISDLYAEPLPPATYKLIAPCEVDSEGNPLEIEVQIPSLPANDALATRIEALIPILQGQKDFKQPICPPSKPQGEFRTIGFISEESSPNGKSRLIKRIRYRSVSGIGLDALIDHWKDFQYNAGPVIVQHRGASWGTVKCWAASADEGKRVIRHAAGEAAIDADQTGRWEISGSTSTRLGMPGTMKINTSGGYFWITARDGATERPLVGKT